LGRGDVIVINSNNTKYILEEFDKQLNSQIFIPKEIGPNGFYTTVTKLI